MKEWQDVSFESQASQDCLGGRWNMIRPFKVIFTIITLLMSGTAFSATINANSCSYAHVSAAVSGAGSGDTVLVPPGNCDWGASTLSTSKAVRIIGAGADKTSISGSGVLFSFGTGSGNYPMRLSGFTLSSAGYYIVLTGTGNGWRIDNNVLNCKTYNCRISVIVNTAAFGNYALIDSNTFNGSGIGCGGNDMSADISWKAAAQWGTGNALFVENNIFNPLSMGGVYGLTNVIDSNNGARWVIRYNQFNDAPIDDHSACQTSVRGARSMEIYNNIFNKVVEQWSRGYVQVRGGSAIITGNVVAGKWMTGPGVVTLDNRRSFWDKGCTANSQCAGVKIPSDCCTGIGTGTCTGTPGFGDSNGKNPYDGNLPNPARGNAVDGWPAMDQIGRGTQTGTMGSGGTQASDPAYIWGNITGKVCLGGENIYGACTSNADCPGSACSSQITTPNSVNLINDSNNQPYHIVAGRDYITNTAKPGYSKYACPHPLAGPGSCESNGVGTVGYKPSFPLRLRSTD